MGAQPHQRPPQSFGSWFFRARVPLIGRLGAARRALKDSPKLPVRLTPGPKHHLSAIQSGPLRPLLQHAALEPARGPQFAVARPPRASQWSVPAAEPEGCLQPFQGRLGPPPLPGATHTHPPTHPPHDSAGLVLMADGHQLMSVGMVSFPLASWRKASQGRNIPRFDAPAHQRAWPGGS